MAFFTDTFTVGSNTELNSHTPDTGTSWTRTLQDSAAEITAIAATDLARPAASVGDSGVVYTADVTYPSANYEVQFTMVTGGTAVRPIYVGVRYQDTSNLYCVRISAAASGARLYKKVSGTWTALGTAVTVANGSVVKVQINGTTLKLFDDGVEVDSVTVSDISAAGKAFLAMGGGTFGTASTDDTNTGVTVDDYSITDLGGGGTGYTQDVSGGITPTGAIIKDGRKVVAGAVSTITGALTKQASKVVSGAVSSIVGTLAKQTNKIVAGAISTIEGVLTTVRVYLISLSGEITPTGAITKQSNKAVSGSNTPTGALSKNTAKSFTGNATPTGALLKSIAKSLSGAISSIAGTLAKQTNKSTSGSLTPVGSIIKFIGKVLSGALSSIVGALSAIGSGSVVTFDFTRPRILVEDEKRLTVEAAKRIDIEDTKTVRFP